MSDTGPGIPAQGEPASIGQLVALLLKQFVKMLPLQLLLGGAMFLGVWVLHTFLLVGPNEGFNAGGGTWLAWLLSQILALQGRMASGSAFWFAISALGGAVVTGLIRRKGAFFSDLGKVPARVGAGFAGGNHAVATVLAAAGLGLLVFGWLGNRILAFVAVGLVLLAVSEGPGGFVALVLRCVYNDGRKALSKPARRLDPARGDGFLSGVMFAAMAYVVLFLLPDAAFMVLGTIGLIAGVLMLGQGSQPAAGATAILLGLLVLASVRIAFGDDGGWAEAGGSFGDWVTSEGAAMAVAMGLSPAAAAAFGAILGVLSGLVPGSIADAFAPVPPVVPVAPVAPTAPAPPGMPPEIEWTGPDGVTRILTYNPEYGGYINNLTGGLVDPANIEGWKQNIAQNQADVDAWRAHNQQLEAAGLDSQSQAMQAIRDKWAAADAAAKAKSQAEMKKFMYDIAKLNKEYWEMKARHEADKARFWNWMTKGAETVETAADFGVNVISNVTGPVGKGIKTIYTITKDVSKNVSAANAKGQSLIKGAGKGLLEAGFDVGFDTLKGTKAVQKIPGFGKYNAPNLSGESLGTIEKGITQTLATGINDSLTKQNLIRGAFKNGIKGAGQSQLQKWLIKDPVKTFVGLK